MRIRVGILFAAAFAACGGHAPAKATATAPPAAPAPTVAADGKVTFRIVAHTQEGVPVGGARVAINAPGQNRSTATGVTGADGQLEMRMPKGSYAFTATAPHLTAVFRPMADFSAAVQPQDIELTLGGPGFTV